MEKKLKLIPITAPKEAQMEKQSAFRLAPMITESLKQIRHRFRTIARSGKLKKRGVNEPLHSVNYSRALYLDTSDPGTLEILDAILITDWVMIRSHDNEDPNPLSRPKMPYAKGYLYIEPCFFEQMTGDDLLHLDRLIGMIEEMSIQFSWKIPYTEDIHEETMAWINNFNGIHVSTLKHHDGLLKDSESVQSEYALRLEGKGTLFMTGEEFASYKAGTLELDLPTVSEGEDWERKVYSTKAYRDKTEVLILEETVDLDRVF